MVGQENLPARQIKESTRRRLPKVEKPEFQQMYAYYEGLGDARTLYKVATQFHRSKAYVALIASAFRWKDRIARVEAIPRDPVVIATKDRVDDSRRKLVSVVHEVVDTLHELSFISKDIKHGKYTDERKARADMLREALAVWGFDWKRPKDFHALVSTLKEIAEFNNSSKSVPQVTNPQQFNIEKFDLVIKDD